MPTLTYELASDVVDTPIGPLALVAGPAGVVSCTFAREGRLDERVRRLLPDREPRRQPDALALAGVRADLAEVRADLAEVRADLAAYFANPGHQLTTPIDLTLATPWQQTVFTALQAQAEYGEVTTYGALAAATGHPEAARAVGAALRTNPVCLFVPCHRVVGADGRLTGYAGGLDAKRTLLTLEGLRLEGAERDRVVATPERVAATHDWATAPTQAPAAAGQNGAYLW